MALIWNYDIYGFNSGRTREYCDLFAENGFLVLLPDYFRGEVFPEELNDQGEFSCRMTDWARLSKDLDDVGKGSKSTFVRLFQKSKQNPFGSPAICPNKRSQYIWNSRCMLGWICNDSIINLSKL